MIINFISNKIKMQKGERLEYAKEKSIFIMNLVFCTVQGSEQHALSEEVN